jgi:hypothetical protein
MFRKFGWLIITLVLFWGIFVSLTVSYAMTKADKPIAFGCDAKSVIVRKDAKNWIIQWQYDPRLEGTQVKINLYRSGKLVRTIAENVTIGKNGRGSWRGIWDDFFYASPDWKAKGYASPDWWVKGYDDPTFNKGKENGPWGKSYQIEIVSLTDGKLRVIGDNASWDWGN